VVSCFCRLSQLFECHPYRFESVCAGFLIRLQPHLLLVDSPLPPSPVFSLVESDLPDSEMGSSALLSTPSGDVCRPARPAWRIAYLFCRIFCFLLPFFFCDMSPGVLGATLAVTRSHLSCRSTPSEIEMSSFPEYVISFLPLRSSVSTLLRSRFFQGLGLSTAATVPGIAPRIFSFSPSRSFQGWQCRRFRPDRLLAGTTPVSSQPPEVRPRSLCAPPLL